MQRCKKMSDIAREGVMFQSESSAGKEYRVFAFRLNEMDSCNCIAFVMARNKEAKRLGLKDKGVSAAGLASDCKHLREVRRVTCQWTQKSEDEYRYDETCPKCGGPVVEEGTPMIPGGVGHDADHVDDLRAMLVELKRPERSDADSGGQSTVAPPGSPQPAAETPTAVDDDDQGPAIRQNVRWAAADPPPKNRHHEIPSDPSDWIEDLIASRGGVIPSGDDWKRLREKWGPVYGKRNIDAAYKLACTPDAVLARQMAREAREAGSASPDEIIEELQDEYHGEPDPKVRLEEIREAIHAENISYGEIAELQGLIEHIDPHDAELLEWAGVSEEDYRAGLGIASGDIDQDGNEFDLDTVMACVDEVLAEYLGGSFAGQASKQIEELIMARIAQPIATVTPITDAPPKPGPDAAAERLAKLIKP